TKSQLTKKVSLMVALAPTILITIPGIAASYMVADFYVYILLFTSVHIGISFIDFLYVVNIAKAPKKSFIENDRNGFDILIKASKSITTYTEYLITYFYILFFTTVLLIIIL